ncbi:fam-m protein [Plasmodium malariae]|uniref:Fam-m protein n=1 Tax=Plasmodium malariae TaxID=5858 RepID=A0A1D3JGZ1_PLAMA|nr:fam-m protein [Plasmodium malariae]SBT85451.1 fam-m protein [Plasmodium malariae]
MDKIIKLFFLIKIVTLSFLMWICLFTNDARILNKLLDEKYFVDSKLVGRACRLLGKHKHEKRSNVVWIKELPNNGEFKKKVISNHDDMDIRKRKQSNRRSLDKTELYTEVIDYDSGMFDGKHYHYEKKWINKKDYDNILKRKRRINFVTLSKMKYKGYGLVVAIFLFLLLFGIGLPILEFSGVKETIGKSLSSATWWSPMKDFGNMLSSFLPEVILDNIFIISYVVSIIMLAIVLVVLIPRILGNNEKYKKIKLMKE